MRTPEMNDAARELSVEMGTSVEDAAIYLAQCADEDDEDA